MLSFVERQVGVTHWLIRSDLAESFTAALAAAGAEPVKHSVYRSVVRMTVNGTQLYIKHNRTPDTRSWLRTLIRPSKARSEFALAQEIARRGVPTVTPVAFGVGSQGETFLATLALPNVEPLGAFLMRAVVSWSPQRRTRFRQLLARALGHFLETMHRAGVVHADLHPDNLLLAVDNSERISLHLIDLTAVRLHDTLTRQQRYDNLVLLNRWFSLRCERTDRMRFWHAYWTAWNNRSVDRAEGARHLEYATTLSNAAFWRHLDRRCCQNNRRYRRVRGRHVSGHVVSDLDAQLLDQLRANPDAPFTLPGARLLKNSPSSKVLDFTWPTNNGAQELILKRFEVTRWLDPWLALMRRSPALRSWIQGHAVRLRWLPTPRPLAVLFRRRHGLEQQAYLLTEKIPDAVELHQALAQMHQLPAAAGRLQLHSLIDQVARLIRNLHQRRLSHRDLKAANILTTGQDRPVTGTDPNLSKVWLIDLVGVRRHKEVSRARRVQNLARLNASFVATPQLSRADRLRFLRLYLQWGTLGRAGWKSWWKAIDQATRDKQRRNQRSGRPLA